MAKAKKSDETIHDENTQGTPAKIAKAVGTTYEKWQVNPKSLGKKEYQLTAIELLKTNVKIAQSTVDMLNQQSHNNGVRYYVSGTIINGNKETVTIN